MKANTHTLIHTLAVANNLTGDCSAHTLGGGKGAYAGHCCVANACCWQISHRREDHHTMMRRILMLTLSY